MDIYEILKKAVELKCSDVHISAGMPPGCAQGWKLVADIG